LVVLPRKGLTCPIIGVFQREQPVFGIESVGPATMVQSTASALDAQPLSLHGLSYTKVRRIILQTGRKCEKSRVGLCVRCGKLLAWFGLNEHLSPSEPWQGLETTNMLGQGQTHPRFNRSPRGWRLI